MSLLNYEKIQVENAIATSIQWKNVKTFFIVHRIIIKPALALQIWDKNTTKSPKHLKKAAKTNNIDF